MKSRVVVTGIGMLTPLGLDNGSSWDGLISGKSGVSHITTFDTTGYETKIAAEVKGFDPFNYLDLKAAKHMDRFSQLAAVASLEAVNQAGLKIDENNCNDVAITIGTGIGGVGRG